MNKIFNVNLGGYPFTIDEDAYHRLNKYLDTIAKHFADSEGCDEILEDIEARMAELFNDRVKTKSIVTLKDLDDVIGVMGRPEDFGAEAMDDDESTSEPRSNRSQKSASGGIKTGKRLFRDSEEKVIGGVCSGMAAYLGIQDPLWVRLAWIASVFIIGIPVILYPILWLIVPEAKTAGDKLAMRGEPANISNIAKTVEEELSDLSNTINEIAKDLTSKKKDLRADTAAPLRGLKSVIAFFGSMILSVLGLFKTILRPIVSLAAGVGILSFGIAWAFLILAFVILAPFAAYTGPSPAILSWLSSLGLVGLIGIPVVSTMLLLTRWFSDYRLPNHIRRWLRLGWVVCLISTALTGIYIGTDHVEDAELKQVESYSLSDNSLTISALDIPARKSYKVARIFSFQYGKNGLLDDDVSIYLLKGDGPDVEIEKIVRAKGNTRQMAETRASAVDATYQVQDGNIALPNYFLIRKKDKVRDQRIIYNIYMPEGTDVTIADDIAGAIQHDGDWEKYCSCDVSKYSWSMGPDGLYSPEWKAEHEATRNISISDITDLNLQGYMNISVVNGDQSNIALKGNKKDIDAIEYISTKGTASLIRSSGYYHEAIQVIISTPYVERISATNVAGLTVEGYTQKEMEVIYHGKGRLKVYSDIDILACEVISQNGNTEATLIGSGQSLELTADRVKVDAAKYKVANATLYGTLRQGSTMYASAKASFPKYEDYHLSILGSPVEINARPGRGDKE